MKAIETVYNGYRFRSRLEARWAVFFDSAGIRYQYEPEGFEVIGFDDEVIRYLPDFYLPDFGVYCEIKPNREQLMADGEKLSWMIDFHGPLEDGLLILGQIPLVRDGDFPTFILYSWHKGVVGESVVLTGKGIIRSSFDLLGYDEPIFSAPDFHFPESDEWVDLCKVRNNFPTLHKDGTVWELNWRSVPVFSYNKARQARFEFGE